jgi:hypothetical protein
MQRQFVTKEEIVNLVNNRVRELPNGGACMLCGVVLLSWPDDEGCNWQPGGIKGIYTKGILQAIREIQAKYNLEDEPQASWLALPPRARRVAPRP